MQPGEPGPYEPHDQPGLHGGPEMPGLHNEAGQTGQSGQTDRRPGPAWIRPPVPEQQPHRVSARTILLPVAAILLHLVVATITSGLYVVLLLVLSSMTGNQDMLATLEDTEALTRLLQQHYPIITVIFSLFLIPAYTIWLAYARRRNPRVLLTERMRPSDLLAGLAMIVGALGLTNLFFLLLEWLAERSPFVSRQLEDYERIAGSFTPDAGIFWLILGICIMAPLTEELLFRGIIQGEFRRVMPEPVAIVLQAVLFAAYHMQPVQSAYALIPGLLLGLAYAWTRSIWVPILMHMTFNFLGSIVPIMNGQDAGLGQIAALSQLGFIAVGLLAGIYLNMNRRFRQALPESENDSNQIT